MCSMVRGGTMGLNILVEGDIQQKEKVQSRLQGGTPNYSFSETS